MSRSTRGWRFEFRPDQTDTLKEALRFTIECIEVRLGDKLPTKSDRMSHTIARTRLQEILDEIEQVTG